jgi:hypothetical protein
MLLTIKELYSMSQQLKGHFMINWKYKRLLNLGRGMMQHKQLIIIINLEILYQQIP